MTKEVMGEDQKKEIEHELELNMGISLPGVGHFRFNMFHQRNEVSVVARNIKKIDYS
jgi:twitching motility protein PilU